MFFIIQSEESAVGNEAKTTPATLSGKRSNCVNVLTNSLPKLGEFYFGARLQTTPAADTTAGVSNIILPVPAQAGHSAGVSRS